MEKIKIKIAKKINSPPKKQKSSNLEIFKKRQKETRKKTKIRNIFSFFF
jgi:hypothetical protein